MSVLRILLIDDDEDDAALTTAYLRESYGDECDVRWISSPEAARTPIGEGAYDVCLVDYRLGAVDGVELVRDSVRRGSRGPFILLTGVDARDVDVQAMAAGVSDYLIKRQITPALLERAIRYAVDAARAQAAVRDSERRLREIAENVREIFWVWDAHAERLTYLSPAFERMLERSPEAAFADPRGVLEWVHPDDRASVTRLLGRLADGHDGDAEVRVALPDGSQRWVHSRAFPIVDPDRGIIRVVGTVEDVTPRRRGELGLELLAAAGRVSVGTLDLQATLAAIADVMVPAFADACVIDLVNGEQQLERCAHKFVDHRKEAAVLALRAAFPLDQRPDHPIWEVLTSGRPYLVARIEPAMVSVIARAPEEMALAERARPESCIFAPLDVGTKVLGVMLLSTDPGRPRFDEADAALAEELGRRSAAVIETAQLFQQVQKARAREGIQADRARRLADVSRRFAEIEFETSLLKTIVELVAEEGDVCAVHMLGTDGRQLPLSSVYHRDAPHHAWSLEARHPQRTVDAVPFARLFDTGRPVVATACAPEELHALLPPPLVERAIANPPAYVLVHLRVLGRTLGTLTVLRESPAAPFTPEEVVFIQDLADRAAMAIENARLYREAQVAAKVRDDVIAVVSHDVANPLNSLLLHATLLASGAVTDTARTSAIMKRSAEEATRIMRDLLDSAVLGSGRLTINPAAEDAAALIAESFEPLEVRAREAGVTLDRAPLEGVRVHADRGRVVQVFGNLLVNALKFTPPGGRVAVQARREGTHVRFSVQDSGIGMEEEHLETVFQPYFQVDRTARRGVGLGLAISKAIIEAHGGRIWAESVRGQGATFHFTLPALD